MSKIVKIKNKYYDFGTTNDSFLLTASELKALGIKNYYFMLEVKYPNLGVQDIDPYDPNLSAEDMGKVIMECKANPWYFFREVSRVPVRGAGKEKLYMHRAACAAMWCFVNSLDFELVQPRQTYKTTCLSAIMSYMVLFEYRNCDIPYMHKTERRCTDNIGILRDYITALPKYLNPWANMKHLPGLQSLKYDAHNVSIAPVSAAKSEDVATDKLRGYSLFAGFVDECEFIPFMKQVIDGANPTVVQARETAKKMGLRTCMMYASTPGDLETTHGREWQQLLDNLPRFNEHMYDLERDDIGSFFDVNGTDEEVAKSKSDKRITMVYIEFNYKQLRKTEEWLEQQHSEAVEKNTLGEYRRGVLLQRFRGDNSALFLQSDLDFMVANTRQPDYEILLLKKFTMYVFKHKIINPDLNSDTPYFDMLIPYMIGIDIATGSGNDNTAIVIVNPYTLEIVAELKSSYMGTFDLMRIITVLAKMLPNALFCPESNSIGKTVIEFVQETNLIGRFFHDPKLDISKNAITKPVENLNDLKQKSIERGYIGTYVTAVIRQNMFELLKRYIHDYKELINTPMIVHEICNLVRNKNGKIEAASGEHDDVVMAYNHILYVLNYGNDLMRFGIDKHRCTFEKVNNVLKQYVEEKREETVNNMIPYENPNAHENQMLHDLTQPSPMFGADGRDEYGYTQEQYDVSGGLKPPPTHDYVMSSVDCAAFMAINDTANGWAGFNDGGGMFGSF